MAKSIFITGATSGIGYALAFEMAKRGYSLGLTARRMDELEKMEEEITKRHPQNHIAISRLDVTEYSEVPRVFSLIADKLGGIDIAYANAGIALGERIGKNEFDKARATIEVNLLGAIATIDAAVTYFLKKGKGHVVGVSSVAALRGMPRSSAYSASKAGIAVYLESLRAETFKKNIDVTVLYPGYIDTPLNKSLPRRPFVITVEKGAEIIANLIEKRVKSSTVPVYPWNIVGKILKILPTGIIARM